MRKLLITLDETLDPWLATHTNQNEIVRNALYVYKGDISTDGIQEIRESYRIIKDSLDEKSVLINERLVYYDRVFGEVEKLVNMLETRM